MKRNNRGFTLIELLAAVIILGILVGISLPAITGMFDKCKDSIIPNWYKNRSIVIKR